MTQIHAIVSGLLLSPRLSYAYRSIQAVVSGRRRAQPSNSLQWRPFFFSFASFLLFGFTLPAFRFFLLSHPSISKLLPPATFHPKIDESLAAAPFQRDPVFSLLYPRWNSTRDPRFFSSRNRFDKRYNRLARPTSPRHFRLVSRLPTDFCLHASETTALHGYNRLTHRLEMYKRRSKDLYNLRGTKHV